MATDSNPPYQGPEKGDLFPHYRDREFDEMVETLNALVPQSFPWKRTHAASGHDDLFGDRIRKNEVYYARSIGDQVVKLSRRSMDSLLFAVFAANPQLRMFAELIVDTREQPLGEIAIGSARDANIEVIPQTTSSSSTRARRRPRRGSIKKHSLPSMPS